MVGTFQPSVPGYLQVESQSAGASGQHEEEVLRVGLVERPQQVTALLSLGGAVQPQVPAGQVRLGQVTALLSLDGAIQPQVPAG